MCLLHFPPAPMSAQNVTRIAGSRTTVYQCCTKSQSVQECASFVSSSGTRTGQRRGRHPTPGDPALWTRAKTEAQIWAKGTTERAIHRTTRKNHVCNCRQISHEGFFPLQFYINSKKFKSAPRQICNHFCANGIISLQRKGEDTKDNGILL